MIDIHIHSHFSFDSDEKPENYISLAQKAGVPVVGFSEHYDYDAYLDGANIGLTDVISYLNYIKELKNNVKNPEILCGIEFGFSQKAAAEYKRLADSYNFDYIINSVHTLPDRGDCYFDEFFKGKTIKELYYDYFNAVLESVKADYDYQIIGHIGYVSRYRSGDGTRIIYEDYSDILDEILKEIIKRDKCLEINSSTGSSGSAYLPDFDVIKRYVQLGGSKLSFGSDAHKAENYLNKSDELKNFLKSIGVNTLYYYKNRQPVGYKI